MIDIFEGIRQGIETRSAELKPLAEEYEWLQAAASTLDDITKIDATIASKAVRKARAKTDAGRRKRTLTRSTQALALIQRQPGITTTELTKKLGTGTNYLYRILPPLQKQGKIERVGPGWKRTEAVSAGA